ncbi:MAG: DUF1700 domain-containing protein [Lachnospiraceae bacterium]|nr:DUF1700 domain-containing protein [Lachnospiraceae bacterium]
MNKEEYLAEIGCRLSGLPQEEIDNRLAYYGEMIDTRVGAGIREADAIQEIGTVDQVVELTMSELHLSSLIAQKGRSMMSDKGGKILLFLLLFPIWFPLLIGFGAAALAIVIGVWSVIFSLYVAVFALGVGSLACIVLAVLYFVKGNAPGGGLMLGAGMIVSGVMLLLLQINKLIVKGVLALTRLAGRGIKGIFVGKKRDGGMEV